MRKFHTYQKGQALIYGIFVLMGGLTALFFLFNAGQVAREKTKLVNTSDAAAYSAGVMNARSLNFLAYTNRALIANEVTIAQMVSLSSWAKNTERHGQTSHLYGCDLPHTVNPDLAGEALPLYVALCLVIAKADSQGIISGVSSTVETVGRTMVVASDAAKVAIQAAQSSSQALFLEERNKVMDEVVRANYVNDGSVKVDKKFVLANDGYSRFEDSPFIRPYAGNDRTRFRDVAMASANKDDFIRARTWRDSSLNVLNGCDLNRRDFMDRTGNTGLISLDEWRAQDQISMIDYRWRFRGILKGWRCENRITFRPASANANANANANASSSANWRYMGLPSYYDLSPTALAYNPRNTNANKQDPKIKFAVRLTRDKSQTRTSEGQSVIKSSSTINNYQAEPVDDVYAAVSAAEVFFKRPLSRTDGKKELASLFNPYWQVRLLDSGSYALVATALQ